MFNPFKMVARVATLGLVGKTDRQKKKRADRKLAETQSEIAEQTLRAMKKKGG